MWILTKFKRIVRDGKSEEDIKKAQDELITSAKNKVAELVKNEKISDFLANKDNKTVSYNENSATVHLIKALDSKDLNEISGTGIMTSIKDVFSKNKLSKVTISIGEAKVTIDETGNLETIKGNIVNNLSSGINSDTKVELLAEGENLGKGVTYTINFTVEETK